MKQACFTEIPLTDKVVIWCRAILFAFALVIKNIICRVWKKHVAYNLPDKPLPCLLENCWGNHMFVKVNGVKFHYVQSGDRKHPLLLLLHGFPDCWLGWRHQITILSKHFRVIALDLKGFGDSEKPQWRIQYNMAVLLQELRQFVRTQGVKRCIVVGHDLGATLGWFFAAQHPVLVSKFVSISGAHPNIYWNHLLNGPGYNPKFIDLCQIPFLPESEVRKDNLSMIDGFFKHLEKNGESSLLDAYKYVFLRTKDVTGPIHYLRNLPMLRLRVAKLRVPTLLIIGTDDLYLPVEALVRSAAFLVTYEMKLVDGAGHFPHQEKPDVVNDFLLSFLLGGRAETNKEKSEVARNSLLESLVTNTFKYGNSFVDNVMKTTNGVVWRPTSVKLA